MADKTYRWYDVDLGLKDSQSDESRYSQEVHVTGGTVDIKPAPTIQRAVINSSGSGNNTVIAADGSLKHKILGMIVVAAGDVTLTIRDGVGGSALFGPVSLAIDGNGFVLPMTTQGYHWIETSAATLLNFQLDAAVQVGGCINYYTEA